MIISKRDGNIIYDKISDFDLKQTLECGQFFRFTENNGVFTLFYRDKCRKMSQNGQTLIVYGCDDDKEISEFFDLNRDYAEIKRQYAKLGDKNIDAACRFGYGIHILKQDMFEALITFIISQNNNIPRIKGIVERLCENFGSKIDGGYAFPTPNQLQSLKEDDLAPLRCGFRSKYIIDAVYKISDEIIDLNAIKSMPYEMAKETLMQIKGVGEKVANCVLLFGGGFLSSFPVDVWIRKTVEHFYGPAFDPAVFGDTAGIAQQYLFYYARENKII